jgi:hypothetical protein
MRTLPAGHRRTAFILKAFDITFRQGPVMERSWEGQRITSGIMLHRDTTNKEMAKNECIDYVLDEGH